MNERLEPTHWRDPEENLAVRSIFRPTTPRYSFSLLLIIIIVVIIIIIIFIVVIIIIHPQVLFVCQQQWLGGCRNV